MHLKTRFTEGLPAKTCVFVIRSCMSRAGRVQLGRPLGPRLLLSFPQPSRVCGFCLHAPYRAQEGCSLSSQGPIFQQEVGRVSGWVKGHASQFLLLRRLSLRSTEHLQLMSPRPEPTEGGKVDAGMGRGHMTTRRK